jgi:hypothetical protein
MSFTWRWKPETTCMFLFSTAKGVAVDRAPSKESCQTSKDGQKNQKPGTVCTRTVWMRTPAVLLPWVYELPYEIHLATFPVYGEGLRPLACWDCGFESRWENWMSLVSIMGCQVEVLCGWPITSPEWSYCVCVCVCHCVWSCVTIILYSQNK